MLAIAPMAGAITGYIISTCCILTSAQVKNVFNGGGCHEAGNSIWRRCVLEAGEPYRQQTVANIMSILSRGDI